MSKPAQIITYENSQLLEVMPHFKIGPYFSKSILLFQKFGVPKTVPLIFGNKNTDFKVW